METQRSRRRNEIDSDPNHIAYTQAVARGDFEGMDPETWLAFRQGELIGTNLDQEVLMEELRSSPNAEAAVMFIQVQGPQVKELGGFFFDADGELHRGVPIVVHDEEGNEGVMGLDFMSDTLFPLPPRENVGDEIE